MKLLQKFDSTFFETQCMMLEENPAAIQNIEKVPSGCHHQPFSRNSSVVGNFWTSVLPTAW